VLTANGKKFGKSEGNALWLDPAKTKPYDIHQYLINVPDALAITYLKMFTFLPLHAI
jgi:tyrosyl-tRNA synthetase